MPETSVEDWAAAKRRELRNGVAKSRWLAAGKGAKTTAKDKATFGVDVAFEEDNERMRNAATKSHITESEVKPTVGLERDLKESAQLAKHQRQERAEADAAQRTAELAAKKLHDSEEADRDAVAHVMENIVHLICRT